MPKFTSAEEYDAFIASMGASKVGPPAPEPEAVTDFWQTTDGGKDEHGRELIKVKCRHPGCAVMLEYRMPRQGRPPVWCDEHCTTTWATRRLRAWEAKYGVVKENWPPCCQEAGKRCEWHRTH